MWTQSILVFCDAASHAEGLSSHALLRGLSKAAGSPGEEKRDVELSADDGGSLYTFNFGGACGEGAVPCYYHFPRGHEVLKQIYVCCKKLL